VFLTTAEPNDPSGPLPRASSAGHASLTLSVGEP
jgi:hypothetical protein